MSEIARTKTHPVMVGSVQVGGGAPVSVQSMCTTKTDDPDATLLQIKGLAEAGCEIIRVAMNAPIQGTAADIMKIAMVQVRRALRREGLNAKIVLQVHDELLVESAPGDASRVQQLLQETMRKAAELKVPLEVDATSPA